MWKFEGQVAPTELSFLNASVLQTGRAYGASLRCTIEPIPDENAYI